MSTSVKVATINKSDVGLEAAAASRQAKEASGAGMDYEDAAKKLIMYSRGIAKGSISTAYGMSMGEDPVLEYLSRQDEGMNPSDLAKTLGYSRPRMTRILDSLEEKGYIVREPDPADRRRVLASCTDAGRAYAHDHSSNGVSNLANCLSKLGDHDVGELLNALELAYSITYDRDITIGDPKDKKSPR